MTENPIVPIRKKARAADFDSIVFSFALSLGQLNA
jgi:hypothetical protein